MLTWRTHGQVCETWVLLARKCKFACLHRIENMYWIYWKIVWHHFRPWAPPPTSNNLPQVIAGYLDHQSTQFRLSASELLPFVSVGLVLIYALSGIPNAMTLPLSSSFIMKKRPFPNIILLFELLNLLQLSISHCLKCVLVIGYCGCRNIKVTSAKTQSWQMFSFKSTE